MIDSTDIESNMGAHTADADWEMFRAMKAAFHTLGCKVNQYETEAIKEAFVSCGAEIVEEDEKADIYVVNTCTVTNIADRKSRQYIRRMKALCPDAVMIVTGCYAQVATDEVESMPEVDLIIGNDHKSEIAERAIAMKAIKAGDMMESDVIGDIDDSIALSNPLSHVHRSEQLTEFEDLGIVTSDESSMCRAYIKIEDGCDRFCSYCLIPYARGRIRSRRPDEILKEAELLISKGYKEIILTGINTALYGTEPSFDFKREMDEQGLSGLEILIKRLDAIDADFRIRLSSLEPTVVSRDNVARLIKYDKLCHHLHLSVQSGSDDVLRAMNRHYSRDEYLEIVSMLRSYDPLYGITTDMIVGFPGETDTDFKDSMAIVSEVGFARVHAFRYSPRKGTKGAKLKDRIPGKVIRERSAELEALATDVAKQFNERNFGRICRVLAEEEHDGFITGYTDNYIKAYIDISRPIDSRTQDIGKIDHTPRLGEFCNVELVENYKDGCKAKLSDDSRMR